jgi:Flp pilus assembly protein TadD
MKQRPVAIAGLVLLAALSGWLGCAGMRAAQLYQSGTQALNAGDGELAVAQLREASRLQPAASEIQNHLGLAYVVAGQQAQALAAFERAVFLDCENSAAIKNLAAARAAAEDQRQADATQFLGGS